jgi:D-alanine-D-alanine ligase
MTVLMLYNQPSDDLADADVLTQLAWVRRTLARLGYQTDQLGVTLDLGALDQRLRQQAPEFVVYLVESLGGSDALLHLPAQLLEACEIPITGSGSDVLKALSSKSSVKHRLLSAGLPTPPWLDPQGDFHGQFDPGPYIIKADREHASRGLDQASVVEATTLDELRRMWRGRVAELGLPCLAERFVPGREFNVSMLDQGNGQPSVLPLAEIDLSSLPHGHLPIVDWNAKWAEGSAEYVGTPRLFPDMSPQPELNQQLQSSAIRCWQLLGLRGYA